ncbi:MAG: AAA family ATPase [Marinifilaceae bacterium]
MKILNLRLKNINSLKGENHIDFTAAPLSNTGLFAITGPTGAGKSTLLDAITLAMYNQVPRSGKLSKNSIQHFGAIITRGTDDCFAEVDYQVNGHTYRSKWEISRARTGNLRDYHMELSRKNVDGEFQLLDLKKGDIPARNAEITGLNYEQFIKSILLSQGEFARFLKANATERSELLEKITGTEIYRQIGQAAYEKLKKENEILSGIEIQLKGIELLKEEEKQEIAAKQKELKEQLAITSKQLKAIKEQLQVKNDLEKASKEFATKEQELAENRKQTEEFAPLQQKLDQHQKLLRIKGDLELCIQQQKQLADLLLKRQKEAEQKIQKLEQLKKLDGAEKEQKEKLLQLEKEKEQLQPLLREIRELDQKIKNQREKLTEQEKELLSSQKEKEELSKQFDAIEKEIQSGQINQKKLNTWLKENALLENAPGKPEQILDLTVSMMQTFQKLNREIKEIDQPTLSQILSKGKNWNEKVNQFENFQQELQKQQNNCAKQLSEKQYSDKKSLEEAINNIRKEQNQLELLQRIQREYLNSAKQLKEQEEQLQQLKKEEKGLKEVLNGEEKKIQILETHCKELEMRLHRQKLEAGLKEYRQELKPGTPCPLCGSTDHPLVQSYQEQVSDTQQLLNGKQKELESGTKANEKRRTQFTRVVTQLEQQIKNRELQEKEEQARVDEFSQNTFAQSRKLEISKTEQLDKQTVALANREKELKVLQTLTEKSEQYTKELQALKPAIEKILQIRDAWKKAHELSAPFHKFTDPNKGLQDQAKDLEKAYNNYLKRKEDLQKLVTRLAELGISQKEKKQQLQKTELLIKEWQKKLQETQKDVKNLDENRKVKFSDKDPDRENNRMDQLLQQAQKLLNETTQQITVTTAAAKHHEQLTVQYTKEHLELDKQKKNTEKELLPLVHQMGFETTASALAALLPNDKAEDLTKHKEQLEKQRIAIQQSIKEKQQLIADLKTKDSDKITREELVKNETELETNYAGFNRNMGSLEQELKKDEENRKKAGEILKQLEQQEKECRRWSNLNELIGDATGNKYSKFAQELTLQQMLSLANRHLLKLNNRYLLKYNPAQNEDLFVVDTLQGNEERSVRTLSGGESFLISLALALGLSDLAGQNTRIESLFIDEGFGSLDQDTLDAALSTLERLQTESNRTIGVISHVTALKERITTQIELNKNSSGYSTVQIRD